jgi:hypothetical protein
MLPGTALAPAAVIGSCQSCSESLAKSGIAL